MKKNLIAGTLLALALSAEPVRADEAAHTEQKSATTFSADARVTEKYLGLRGFVPEPRPSLQSGLYLTHSANWGTLKASTWVSALLEGDGITEVDLGVSYHRDIGRQRNVHVAVGANAYYLPDPELHLQEVWGSIGVNNALKPSLTVYHDYSRDGNGQYAELAVQPTISIGDRNLDLTVALMYNSEYFVEGAGISGVRVKLQYPLCEGKRWAIDVDVRGFVALNGQQKSNYNMGLTLRLK